MLQHITYAINEEKHLDSQATQSGSNSQTGTQNSVTGLGQEPPPPKRLRKDDSDVKEEDKGEESGALVPLSEVVSQAGLLFLFLIVEAADKTISEEASAESAFKSKLNNALRKAKAKFHHSTEKGTPSTFESPA